MKRRSICYYVTSVLIGLFMMASCSETAVYQNGQVSEFQKLEQDKNVVIILHEKYINTQNDEVGVASHVVDALNRKLKKEFSGRYRFYSKHRKIVAENGKKPVVLFLDVYSDFSEHAGKQVRVITKSKSTKYSRESWDVTEHQNVKKFQLHAVVNIKILKVDENPTAQSEMSVTHQDTVSMKGNQGSSSWNQDHTWAFSKDHKILKFALIDNETDFEIDGGYTQKEITSGGSTASKFNKLADEIVKAL